MPRSTIQIHLFRIYVRHHVASLSMDIDYPVTGVVVVPRSVTDVNAYMEERQVALAQLRLTQVLVKSPGYGDTAASMMMAANIRKHLGLQPRMPGARPFHTPTAATCEACQEVALCSHNRASYDRLRARLEEICSKVTKPNPDFCQALSLRLNTHAE